MKTIDMNSAEATNKKYKRKCIQYEKILRIMAVYNASLNDRAATINQEIEEVEVERKYLLEKLAESNIEVEQAQLSYKGKCEAKFYKDCCKERLTKKKSSKKSQRPLETRETG